MKGGTIRWAGQGGQPCKAVSIGGKVPCPLAAKRGTPRGWGGAGGRALTQQETACSAFTSGVQWRQAGVSLGYFRIVSMY
jgi:hypothetical protein